MNAPVFIKLLNVEWHNVAGVKQKDFLRGTIKDHCWGILMIVSFWRDLQNFNYYLCLITYGFAFGGYPPFAPYIFWLYHCYRNWILWSCWPSSIWIFDGIGNHERLQFWLIIRAIPLPQLYGGLNNKGKVTQFL